MDVRAAHRALEVAEAALNRVGVNFSSHVFLGRMLHCVTLHADQMKIVVTLMLIGAHGLTTLHVVPDDALNRRKPIVWDRTGTHHAVRALPCRTQFAFVSSVASSGGV